MTTIISYSERKKYILLKHKKEKQQSRLIKGFAAFMLCASITLFSIAVYDIYNSCSKSTEILPIIKDSTMKFL